MLSILFTGDYAPIRRYESMVIASGIELFGDLKECIHSSDIAYVNIETPFTISGSVIPKSGPTIKAIPECFDVIAEVGFKVAGLANNHIMDFGIQGLQDTINICERNGLRWCGAGRNIAEAQRPLVMQMNGLKVSFIAVAEIEFNIAGDNKPGVAPLDLIDTVNQIENIRDDVDVLLISIHGGNEYCQLPRPGLQKTCRFLIDKGADAVVCHHSHVPGAFEIYKDKVIIYGLGNLIFDHLKPPIYWNLGYAAKLNFTKSNGMLSCELIIIPYNQSVEKGGVRLLRDNEKDAFLNHLKTLSTLLNDKYELDRVWKIFCASREKEILLRMFFPQIFSTLLRFARIFPVIRYLLPRKIVAAPLNIVRCESHREMLITILEKYYAE